MRPLRSPHGPCWTANDTTRKTFLLHTIRSTNAGLKAALVLQDPMSVLCKGDEPLDHPFGLPNHSPPGNNRIVPLHNVKQPAPNRSPLREPRSVANFFRMRTSRRQRRRDRFFLHQSQVIAAGQWWSQTGSNRRHRACKARALPAELWPRSQNHRPRRALANPQWPEGGWWAWEDLNFRPHAYQARALTN